jgi:hypothetical protein
MSCIIIREVIYLFYFFFVCLRYIHAGVLLHPPPPEVEHPPGLQT